MCRVGSGLTCLVCGGRVGSVKRDPCPTLRAGSGSQAVTQKDPLPTDPYKK